MLFLISPRQLAPFMMSTSQIVPNGVSLFHMHKRMMSSSVDRIKGIYFLKYYRATRVTFVEASTNVWYNFQECVANRAAWTTAECARDTARAVECRSSFPFYSSIARSR
jgi:hypothetical protein